MGVRAAQTGLRVAGAIALVWVLYLLRANVWFRLYPAVVVAVALVVFAVSLRGTPLVERIARARGEALDARGVAYCRAVTRAWVVFLSLHLAVTVATAFAPPAGCGRFRSRFGLTTVEDGQHVFRAGEFACDILEEEEACGAGSVTK